MGSCDRCKGRVYTKEGEGVPAVKGGKGGGKRVCKRAVKKEIYSAIEITTNSAGVFCREERWEEKNGAGLQRLKQTSGQSRITTHSL